MRITMHAKGQLCTISEASRRTYALTCVGDAKLYGELRFSTEVNEADTQRETEMTQFRNIDTSYTWIIHFYLYFI